MTPADPPSLTSSVEAYIQGRNTLITFVHFNMQMEDNIHTYAWGKDPQSAIKTLLTETASTFKKKKNEAERIFVLHKPWNITTPFAGPKICTRCCRGLSFDQISSLFQVACIANPVSNAAFYRFQEKITAEVTAMREETMDAQLKKYEGQKISVAMDARWSHRRNAMEGTMTVYHADTSEMLDVCHIIQDRTGDVKELTLRENDTRTYDFVGNSNSYEAFGAGVISKRLKDANIEVQTVVKDDNVSTINEIKKHHPDCKEQLDENHLKKNIPKRVLTIGRTLR
ncbi:hypothetical protein HK102_001073 [Quaeritorhiza haematococci]|nr:hypothetical protein HK102_001073 [Quaeritorhiza haematococci]